MTDSVTVNATQLPVLTLDKTTTTATFGVVGAVITYSYNLKNTGNVTLAGLFTVTDDKTSVTCPNDISLAVGASIDCAATYAVTQTDLNAGSVTNTAKGHALFGATPVDSNEDSVTVNATPTPPLTLDKTADPTSYNSAGQVSSYTPVATNTSTNTPTNTPTASPTLAGTPTETPTPTPTATPALTWTPEAPLPMGTAIVGATIPQPQAPMVQAAPARASKPGAIVVASSAAGAAPIINLGAYVKWQYAGVEYWAVSNPVINGKRIFLPVIMKGVG